jgi:hypothetical protein
MIPRIMILSIAAPNIMTPSITTLDKIILTIRTLSITLGDMTPRITTLRVTPHNNDTQHNSTWHPE